VNLDVVVVDYDSGNLRSVEKAIEFLDCMSKLEAFGLAGPIRDRIVDGVPFFGICVGYQLLFEESEEFGHCPGLGILRGRVVRFPEDLSEEGQRLKVPHMGWNRIWKRRDVPVLAQVEDGAYVYFVHSYYPVPEDPDVAATTTRYGVDFASSVARGNIFASQFHPEKSQRVGLSLLRGFLRQAEKGAGR
jgi:glutamine amidotransferase